MTAKAWNHKKHIKYNIITQAYLSSFSTETHQVSQVSQESLKTFHIVQQREVGLRIVAYF